MDEPPLLPRLRQLADEMITMVQPGSVSLDMQAAGHNFRDRCMAFEDGLGLYVTTSPTGCSPPTAIPVLNSSTSGSTPFQTNARRSGTSANSTSQ